MTGDFTLFLWLLKLGALLNLYFLAIAGEWSRKEANLHVPVATETAAAQPINQIP